MQYITADTQKETSAELPRSEASPVLQEAEDKAPLSVPPVNGSEAPSANAKVNGQTSPRTARTTSGPTQEGSPAIASDQHEATDSLEGSSMPPKETTRVHHKLPTPATSSEDEAVKAAYVVAASRKRKKSDSPAPAAPTGISEPARSKWAAVPATDAVPAVPVATQAREPGVLPPSFEMDVVRPEQSGPKQLEPKQQIGETEQAASEKDKVEKRPAQDVGSAKRLVSSEATQEDGHREKRQRAATQRSTPPPPGSPAHARSKAALAADASPKVVSPSITAANATAIDNPTLAQMFGPRRGTPLRPTTGFTQQLPSPAPAGGNASSSAAEFKSAMPPAEISPPVPAAAPPLTALQSAVVAPTIQSASRSPTPPPAKSLLPIAANGKTVSPITNATSDAPISNAFNAPRTSLAPAAVRTRPQPTNVIEIYDSSDEELTAKDAHRRRSASAITQLTYERQPGSTQAAATSASKPQGANGTPARDAAPGMAAHAVYSPPKPLLHHTMMPPPSGSIPSVPTAPHLPPAGPILTHQPAGNVLSSAAASAVLHEAQRRLQAMQKAYTAIAPKPMSVQQSRGAAGPSTTPALSNVAPAQALQSSTNAPGPSQLKPASAASTASAPLLSVPQAKPSALPGPASGTGTGSGDVWLDTFNELDSLLNRRLMDQQKAGGDRRAAFAEVARWLSDSDKDKKALARFAKDREARRHARQAPQAAQAAAAVQTTVAAAAAAAAAVSVPTTAAPATAVPDQMPISAAGEPQEQARVTQYQHGASSITSPTLKPMLPVHKLKPLFPDFMAPIRGPRVTPGILPVYLGPGPAKAPVAGAAPGAVAAVPNALQGPTPASTRPGPPPKTTPAPTVQMSGQIPDQGNTGPNRSKPNFYIPSREIASLLDSGVGTVASPLTMAQRAALNAARTAKGIEEGIVQLRKEREALVHSGATQKELNAWDSSHPAVASAQQTSGTATGTGNGSASEQIPAGLAASTPLPAGAETLRSQLASGAPVRPGAVSAPPPSSSDRASAVVTINPVVLAMQSAQAGTSTVPTHQGPAAIGDRAASQPPTGTDQIQQQIRLRQENLHRRTMSGAPQASAANLRQSLPTNASSSVGLGHPASGQARTSSQSAAGQRRHVSLDHPSLAQLSTGPVRLLLLPLR